MILGILASIWGNVNLLKILSTGLTCPEVMGRSMEINKERIRKMRKEERKDEKKGKREKAEVEKSYVQKSYIYSGIATASNEL